MRSGPVAAVTILVLALAPLAAYVQNQRSSGAPMRRADFNSIRYLLDESTAPGLRNTLGQFTITPGSDPLGALQAALDQWNDISSSEVQFAPFELSSGTTPRNDGVNLVTFADTPQTRSLLGDAVAVTFLFSGFNGVLTDTDILFNPRLRFSTEPDGASFDIQGTLAHELGHAIGLDHTGILGATMFATTTRGTNRIARLAADDIAFALHIYPSGDTPQAFGEIRGKVTFNFGPPVEGAHVVAADSEQNIVLGAISEPDGSYRIAGVPAGRYWLYAEPLDGPVEESQLGPTRRSPDLFLTSFYGGLGSPLQLVVGPGTMVAADMVVANGSPALNIQGSSAAPLGASTTSRLLAEMQPGGVFEMEIYGEGLDNPAINEASISFLGAALRVIPGTLERDTVRFNDGSRYPLLAFDVESPPDTPSGLLSVLVATPTEVAALSGGVAIVNPVPQPRFVANGVTNAGSFLSGPVAPGEIVSIFGENLGPQTGLSGDLDASGRLVRMLGGVTVTFNGLPAPIFFASSGQLNVQVPVALAGDPDAVVLIQHAQALSAPIFVELAAARPGLFTAPLSSAVIALNEDASLNSASNPARRGEIVSLFGTGQGPTDPPLGSGQPAGSAQLSRVIAPLTVTIGGQQAAIEFAGLAPGFVGLLQLNVRTPLASSIGPATPVELIIDGTAAQQNATIAIE